MGLLFLVSLFVILSVRPFKTVAGPWMLEMNIGSSFSTSDPPLRSATANFIFGFNHIPEKQSYLLSVRYGNIPDTIVWYAYSEEDGKAITAPKGSRVTLTSTQGLLLIDPRGKKMWSSYDQLVSKGGGANNGNNVMINNTPNIHCVLNDTGNLMITNGGGGGTAVLWQSFDFPTDTLLPTQVINGSEIGGGPLVLYSRISQYNFTRGRFMLRLVDGNFTLNLRNPLTDNTYDFSYYTIPAASSSNSSSGYRLSYDVSGHMYVLTSNGSRVDLIQTAGSGPGSGPSNNISSIPTPAEDYYFRATLDFDGVFSWYYHPKKMISPNNYKWKSIKSVPENTCGAIQGELSSGACGYNSICTLGTDQRPKCHCPPGYSLVDPNNSYGDCKPDFEISSCNDAQKNGSTTKYRMEKLPQTNFAMADYDKVGGLSQEECMNWCLEDCYCAAVISGVTACWKKRFPLSNGHWSSGITTAFIKVGHGYDDLLYNSSTAGTTTGAPRFNNSMDSYGGDHLVTFVVISALLGTSALFNLVLIALIGLGVWWFYHKQIHLRIRATNYHICKYHEEYDTVRCFTYRELKEATDGFKEELGRGACAIVYKGNYPTPSPSTSNSSSFAVKKIDLGALKDAHREFKTEVTIIGKTHHKNLVKLIGFCEEDNHRMLVYEFMSNGSLADLLFGKLRPSWAVRIHIAKGIARGLLYLHDECTTQIIHCDIKAQNILLDDSYNAKISDFGLSKLLKLNQFQTHTAVRGTKGYVAPDWFKNKAVDVKVDVYSFGVLLLEIVSCRRCIDFDTGTDDEIRAILTDWAIDCYLCDELAALVRDDYEALQDMQEVKKFVLVALWSIQEDPKVRPTMRQVTQMLESVVEVPNPPCPNPDSFTTSSPGDLKKFQ